jgi:predicted Zn finger-like uncharacterized protein
MGGVVPDPAGDWKTMRLVCPNCDAQYEVDDAAIPMGGRDVQCSNCGHAWFQIHPEEEAALSLEDEVFEPVGAPPPEIVVAEETKPEFEDDFPEEFDEKEEPMFPADPGDAPPPPRRVEIDESVLAVLREEAEREASVRRVEAPGGVEVQPDLGLQAPPLPPSVLAAKEKFRELSIDHEEDEGAPDEATARPASRRELLPDIEEINSTLRASGDRRGEEEDVSLPPQYEDRRSGFRSGFVLMIVISVALWMAYVMAPKIVAQIPASAGAMESYVAAVNTARIGVDRALQSASKSLRSLSGEDAPAP